MYETRSITSTRAKARSKSIPPNSGDDWLESPLGGCLRCKQRKIKCDEAHPHCNQCTRKGYECPGYKRPLRWSSKHEVAIGSETRERRSQRYREDDPMRTGQKAPLPTSRPEVAEVVHDQTALETEQYGPMDNSQITENEALLSIDLLTSGSGVDVFGTESLQWPDVGAPIFPSLEDQDSSLFRYYFSLICRINSCFDSDKNLFRVGVGELTKSCPLIHHCILSMSAAHRSCQQGDLATAALDHRTKAISCLRAELIKQNGENDSYSTSSVAKEETLLGSILLGMTEGWHNPSQLGITHLHGARGLFISWIADNQKSTGPCSQIHSSPTRSFMVGIMAYWEAMASFVIDQPLDVVAYLELFLDRDEMSHIHPNPWTGICTPLFIYLAKVGILGRQKSMLKKLSITNAGAGFRDKLQSTLVEQARETEKAVLRYRLPADNRIEDTGDILTPVHHLHQVAQIYRFATILELYLSFPELLPEPTANAAAAPSNRSIDKVLTLASSVLTLIRTIPSSSGANVLLNAPLIIAGSTLQPTCRRIDTDTGRHDSSWDVLYMELLSLSSQEDVYLHWRDFVRERIEGLYSHVGVATVRRGMEVLDKVWTRADIKALVDVPDGMANAADLVKWTDVMVEERLETILG